MRNVELVPVRRLSPFRSMAIGTWRTAKDPSVYGTIEVEADEALRYIDAVRAHTGRRVTVTHLTAIAVSRALRALPEANAIVRLDRIYLRKHVDLFFQVAMTDEATGQIDLSGLIVRDVDQKSLTDLVDEFEQAVTRVRAWQDGAQERARRTFRALPGFLVGPALDVVSFLCYTLNLNLSWLGIPRDPFGSAAITNVGSLGLTDAFVPLVPYARLPILVAVGALERKPVVREGDRIEAATILRLCATLDHRVIDGAHAAKMANVLRQCFADPWTSFGGVPRPA